MLSRALTSPAHHPAHRILSCVNIRYDFTAALTDVSTMITTARILELVGVGAYEGGAILITDKNVLAGAGKILGIEARHASLLNTFDRGDFSPSPL